MPELESDSKNLLIDNLVFDGCHFGREFVLLLFRSQQKNIYYDFKPTEKIVYFKETLRAISQRHTLQSFTIDGRRGVVQLLEKMFPALPVQLCQFHMVSIVLRYTTRSPKTTCGKDLKALILDLKSSSEADFRERFKDLTFKYADFLKERNENGKFIHKLLRSAFRSIKNHLPCLFTFERFPALKIEKTTNSCDGYFAHLKSLLRIHPGISSRRKIQLIIKLISS